MGRGDEVPCSQCHRPRRQGLHASVPGGRSERAHSWHPRKRRRARLAFSSCRIDEDGHAKLRLDGVVNNPTYAINDAERGKEYSYRVKAQFHDGSGVGQRLTGRVCEFTFTR